MVMNLVSQQVIRVTSRLTYMRSPEITVSCVCLVFMEDYDRMGSADARSCRFVRRFYSPGVTLAIPQAVAVRGRRAAVVGPIVIAAHVVADLV